MATFIPRPARSWLALGLMALLCLGSMEWNRTVAGPVWHWSNPLPHGNNIAGLAHRTNGYYVQVTDHGQLYSSFDRVRWEPRETGTRRALRGAAFLGTRLIVSGEQGTILWADDLQEIHRIDLGTENWLEGVAASPDVAVAVGDNGTIFRSTNGEDWTRVSVPFGNWLRGIVWGGDLFVAVGEDDGIFTSPDGLKWTPRKIVDGTGANLNKGAWTGNGFVIAGDAVDGKGTIVFGSADGESWTLAEPPSGATRDLITAAADSPNSRIVAGDLEMWLYSVRPNPGWASLISNNPEDGPPPAVYLSSLWDGARYVFGGRTGRTVVAERGPLTLDWFEYPSPPRSWLFDLTTAVSESTNTVADWVGDEVHYRSTRTTNSFFVAAGDYATLLTSDNGVVWNTALPPTNAANRTYLGVAGNRERLVAVGNGGLVSISPIAFEPLVSVVALTNGPIVVEAPLTNWINTLGLAWYPANSPTDRDLQAVCATTNLLVIGGEGGFLATSTDGTNWTPRTSGTTAFLSGLEASREGFVAVGDAGTILTSPDAITWTRQVSPTDRWIYRVRLGGDGTWVAVGENGVILTSPNRLDWTLRTTGLTNWLNDAEWAAGSWYVSGNQGVVLTSTNAIEWTLDTGIITGKSLYAAATLDNRLVIAGVDGVILRTRVAPFTTPVELVRFPISVSDHLFQISGQTDQIFRLDRTSSLTNWIEGPILEITRPDGSLLYFDPATNDPNSQLFAAPNLN